MIWRQFHRERARATCEKWRGLRHINRQAVEGKGIDCIRLVLECYFDAELLEREPIPNYPDNWGLAAPRNIIADALEDLCSCHRIPIADWDEQPWNGPAFGDIVIWRAGVQSNHVGIVIDDQIWHVLRGGKVGPTAIGPVRRRAQEAVRLHEKGWRKKPTSVNMRDYLNE